MKIKFGDIKPEDFTPKVYSIDSFANAVYLFDGGNTKFTGNNKGYFNVLFTKHTRIQLINKNGFGLATVKIPLYVHDNIEQKLEDFDAATYNIKDGKVIVTKVDKNSIYKDKSEKYVTIKFTFPNIQEGSIIEYSYSINSPGYYHIEPWYFQGEYPRLWSEYEITVPQFYDYAVIKQGYQPLILDTGKLSYDNYSILYSGEDATARSEVISISANTIKHV